jgi:hypothetical protein
MVHALFAAQVLLDISRVLGEDLEKPFSTLMTCASTAEKDLNDYIKVRLSESAESWTDSGLSALKQEFK